LPTIAVPNGGGDHAAGTHDAAHLLDRLSGVGDEMQHQQREGTIERRIRIWQRSRVAHVESKSRIGVSRARGSDEGLRQIYSGNRCDMGEVGRANARLPVLQPMSSTRSPSPRPPNLISEGASRRLHRPLSCS
jgi:hypothetical protein